LSGFIWCLRKSVKETSPTMYKQFQLACDFLTILHFTQDELEKERTVRKDLEQQVTALLEESSSRRETERHMQVSHCIPCLT